MEEMIVECPNCGTKFSVSTALQEKIRQALREEAQEEFQKKHKLELDDLQQQLADKSGQLIDAHKIELKLRQQQRVLDEKLQNQELEIQRRIDDIRKQIAKDSKEKAESEYRLKLAEKENQLEAVIAELEETKRKAEQGSQQMQGEAAELDLEDVLSTNFPYDLIEPVGKGVRGADIHQHVRTLDGQTCGIIIWESKNTKSWNDRWLSKLKEDQLDTKAEIAVIVSAALPEDVLDFTCIDGIWVTGFPHALSLAAVLREIIIQVAKVRRSAVGKDEKIELLYRYFSGLEFKHRVEMLVNTFMAMKSDLDREKIAMTRSWSQREKCIEKMITGIAGMYGDLQGIVGAVLVSIPVLELPEGTD